MPVLFTERVPAGDGLTHLIQNAYKHHDHPERGCVTITVEDLGDATQFSVADDGLGIAPEFQVQVFDLFRTPQAATRLRRSGMGLSVVKNGRKPWGRHPCHLRAQRRRHFRLHLAKG